MCRHVRHIFGSRQVVTKRLATALDGRSPAVAAFVVAAAGDYEHVRESNLKSLKIKIGNGVSEFSESINYVRPGAASFHK